MYCDKSQLRQELYVLRAAIVREQPRKVAQLQAQIAAWLLAHPCRCVGLYRPIRYEPDITDCVADWCRQQTERQMCVPVLDSMAQRSMHYAQWWPGANVRRTHFGIEEPVDTPVMVPDVIFSPCVGVTPAGVRLGNGGGFFDVFLQHARSRGQRIVTVAVAFDALITERFEPQIHDVAFDWIATETGCVRSAYQ